jgi:curved DNA-binding protein
LFRLSYLRSGHEPDHHRTREGFAMTDDQGFVDYYDILQVSPDCDAKTLESAYHSLAKTSHPDHTGSEETTRFNEVTAAFRILRNPKRRAEYDTLYASHNKKEWFEFRPANAVGIDEKAAIDDAEDHAKVLMFLYKQRRENAQNAGVVGFYLQELLDCSDEHFDFHKWYLKEKGFISITEQGTLAITIQGVDHVISMSRTTEKEKLLIAKPVEEKAAE